MFGWSVAPVFCRWRPAWPLALAGDGRAASSLTTLGSFDGGDGAYPEGTLVRARNGAFYGATAIGGSTDRGVVFELAPPPTAGGACG